MLCTLTAKLPQERRGHRLRITASCLLVAYKLKKVTDGGVQVFSFSILFPLLNESNLPDVCTVSLVEHSGKKGSDFCQKVSHLE